jgi:hypothetical protein
MQQPTKIRAICNVNRKPIRQAGIVTRHGSWKTVPSMN